jgi:hypothetical protein
MVIDLGDQPEPEIEPPEPPPGGVDAVEDQAFEPQPVVPDLARVGNEHNKDEIPEAVTEPDETDTAATRDDDVPDHQESPA